jgi:hypothetical protein
MFSSIGIIDINLFIYNITQKKKMLKYYIINYKI